MAELLIYTPDITNRIRFTFDFMLKESLGLNYKLTNEKEHFLHAEKPKFTYADEPIGDELFFKRSSVLQEKEIHRVDVGLFKKDESVFLFPVKNSNLLFDPFAASFYLLSRYEEYLPFETDIHGRFPAKASLAFKNGFLQEPVVDQWVLMVKEVLKGSFKELKIKGKKYSFEPTIDIDQAFLIREKGFFRQIGALLKLVLKRDFARLKTHLKVLLENRLDPNDTFQEIDLIHSKNKNKALFFFLVGDHGPFDKSNRLKSKAFQQRIQQTAKNNTIGLHPSYASNSNTKSIQKEKNRLEKIIKKEVVNSRQHFLKFSFPKTYRNLIEAGIEHDYSMGYADDIGFRAGTAHTFYYYDLGNEQSTRLRIHPFMVMDVTLKNYLGLNPEQAIGKIKELIFKIRSVNGIFTSLWHNESLSEFADWKDWKKV